MQLMKILALFLALSFTNLLSAETLDMQQYMRDTEALAKQGEYEKALERTLWFHDNALKHQPSMSGVRLSFALGDWMDLAEKYPAALKAMQKVRDEKTDTLKSGRGNFNLFMDVNALNRTLKEESKTIDLFRLIDEKQPDLAKICWIVAKPVVIKNKGFDLADKYLGNLLTEFDVINERYEMMVSRSDKSKVGRAQLKSMNENRLVEETLLLIETAKALNEVDTAKEIQKRALGLLDDRRLRKALPSSIGDESF